MKKTVVLGVIGSDSHVIGYWVLRHVLETAGFKVVGLGGMSSQQEFIEAAVETKADAIWITSHYGMAPLDCEGFREKLEEAGLKNIPLSIGGILTTDPNEEWAPIEARFNKMGFDHVYPPQAEPAQGIADLKKDLGMTA